MRHLHLILVSIWLLSSCKPSGSNALVDQINGTLRDGGTLDSIPVRSRTEEKIIEVMERIQQGQEAAAGQSVIVPETEALFHAADSLADEVDAPGLSIWTDTQIGFYYYSLSQLETAFPYFLKSSKRFASTRDRELIDPVDCFLKNAYFFGNIGEHTQAVAYLTEALRFVDTTGTAYASIQFALGAEYCSLGDAKQAEEYFILSKNSAKQRDPVRYAKALGELALLAMRGGNLAEAEELLEEDIRLSREHGDERNTMFARIRLASIYMEKEDWEAAQSELELAVDYVRSRSNLMGFDQQVSALLLTVAEARGDEAAQLTLHRHLQATAELLKSKDGERAVLTVNLALQQARAENDRLLQHANLERAKMEGAALLTVCVLLVVIALFLRRSKKQALHVQELKFERAVTQFQLDKIRSESKYAQAQQTIQSYFTFLQERNAAIDELKKVVAQLRHSSSPQSKDQRHKLELLMQDHLMTEENWHRFKTTFIMEYADFYTRITEELPGLTESQLRIVLLQKLGLNNQGMADLLGVGQDSIKKAKQRLRKKYGNHFDEVVGSPTFV